MEKLKLSFKRFMATVVSVVMMTSMLPVGTVAVNAAKKTGSVKVYLTVSDKGNLAKAKDGSFMAVRELTVTDENSNGEFDVDDAMRAAHDNFNSANGYFINDISHYVEKFWGYDTGAIGFYVNDVFDMGHTINDQVIKDNDYLVAGIFADDAMWSDWYSTFDSPKKDVTGTETVTLTLKGFPYGRDFSGLSSMTVKTTDGKVLGTTDANGQVQYSFSKAGTYIVTAEGKVTDKGTEYAIFAPACVIKVNAKAIDKKTKPVLEAKKFTKKVGDAPFQIKVTNGLTDLKWHSSKTKVADVDDEGNVTIKAKGSTTISATASNGKKATCSVKVSDVAVTSVTFDQTSLEMVKGGEAALTATILPANYTGATLKWSTSNKKVVTVENGKLKAVKPGKAKITLKAGKKKATCQVKVNYPAMTSSKLLLTEANKIKQTDTKDYNKTTQNYELGDKLTFKAEVLPADADQKLVWTSSNKSIAKVGKSTGKVTINKKTEGTAVIKAVQKSSGAVVAEFTINAKARQ